MHRIVRRIRTVRRCWRRFVPAFRLRLLIKWKRRAEAYDRQRGLQTGLAALRSYRCAFVGVGAVLVVVVGLTEGTGQHVCVYRGRGHGMCGH
jgi:hypothetical protein